MKCDDIKQQTILMILGDLERDAHADVVRHLSECESCREEESELRRDVGRISAAMETGMQAPAQLTGAVANAISVSKPRPRYLPRLAVAAAAFAVVLSVVVWQRPVGHAKFDVGLITRDFNAAAGSASRPPSNAEISDLSRAVGFPIETMPFSPDAKLIDCRLVDAGDAKGAVVEFEWKGESVVVYQIPKSRIDLEDASKATAFDENIYHWNGGEFTYLAFNCRDCIFVAVAKMTRNDLVRISEPWIRMS
ncbi:MAG: hypothetical protein ACR2HJ_04770 [Fimbriimonadales bacterium]